MTNRINENEEIRNANDKAREDKQAASAEAAAVKAKAEEKLKKDRAKQKAREDKQRLKAREERQATAEINKANRSMRSNLYRTKVANNRSKAQAELGTGATKAATTTNLRKTQAATAKNYSTAIKKMQSAAINNQKKRAKLQQMSTEYDMSTVEIISESCMVGLNEDMYFKVKIEGLPTMYVNSANREELRKDLVGLLRNPSKAVGNIKRVTPAEVKKRLRLRSQGKEEEEMDESYIKFDHPKLKYISKGFMGRKEAERHNDHLYGKKKASGQSYVLKHKDNKFYVVDRKESVEMDEATIPQGKTAFTKSKQSGPTDVDMTTLHKLRKMLDKEKTPKAKAVVDESRSLPPIVSVVRDGIVRSIPSQDLENHEGMGWRHIVNPDDHKGIQAKQTRRAESVDCWDGYKKQGTKPGTGKNKGQQVNNCVPEAVSDIMSKLKNHYMNESEAYHAGLSPSTTAKRKAHFKKYGKKADDNNSAYKPAPGDATAETKPSIHTKKAAAMGMGPKNEAGLWANIHAKRKRGEKMRKKGAKGAPTPEAIRSAQKESYNINENKKGLENKAEKSGMPLGVLKQVYNRGMAAWKTGHRPGTTPEQWGMARVNSFITKSSGTWGKADKDLAAKVKK